MLQDGGFVALIGHEARVKAAWLRSNLLWTRDQMVFYDKGGHVIECVTSSLE